jgi:hypothetical protein
MLAAPKSSRKLKKQLASRAPERERISTAPLTREEARIIRRKKFKKLGATESDDGSDEEGKEQPGKGGKSAEKKKVGIRPFTKGSPSASKDKTKRKASSEKVKAGQDRTAFESKDKTKKGKRFPKK